MKPILYIFVSAVFTHRDYNRMGIPLLTKRFNVHIVDLSYILYPDVAQRLSSKRIYIDNLFIFRDSHSALEFTKSVTSGSIFIDYMSSGLLQSQVRLILKTYHCLRVKVFAGATPLLPRGSAFRSRLILLRNAAQCIYFSTRANLSSILSLPDELSNISIWPGTSCRFLPLAHTPKKIYGHNFDYDLFLNHRDLVSEFPSNQYFVFIDQNLITNHDRHITDLPPIVSDKYIRCMNNFFRLLENTFNIPVIIAGHPRAEGLVSPYDAQVVYDKTPQLIQNSLCVFAHYSAAINLAVLWKKPIHILTSSEISSSVVWKAPLNFAASLRLPVHHIDNLSNFFLSAIRDSKVNHLVYQSYINKYIKMPGSAEDYLWNIASSELLNYSFSR